MLNDPDSDSDADADADADADPDPDEGNMNISKALFNIAHIYIQQGDSAKA